ncbi:unnamed protein product [Somion occarium]|uniref:Uncharacterized protein n=1 Tax=Somion occarium TaxID=3059160 RepID=A0ABP1CRU2_9APHY
MESLNLNMLATSLPNSNLANAEADLSNNFKAAALALTTLYKSSRKASKRAYNAGYSAACRDLLLMIQQGVSAGEPSEAGGMSIGRIMDYVEARLEAIQSQEEEEDEDEEREKERGRSAPVVAPSRTAATSTTPKSPIAPSTISGRQKDQVLSMPLTPHTPSSLTNAHSPLSPSPVSFRPTSAPIQPTNHTYRAMKSKLSAVTTAKDTSIFSPLPSTSFNTDAARTLSSGETAFTSPVSILPPMSASPTDTAFSDISTGMKRRHNAMMLDSGPGVPSLNVSAARRRTRSTRGAVQDQNQTQGTDDMDVEEEGRERKRVARR